MSETKSIYRMVYLHQLFSGQLKKDMYLFAYVCKTLIGHIARNFLNRCGGLLKGHTKCVAYKSKQNWCIPQPQDDLNLWFLTYVSEIGRFWLQL